MEKPFAQWICEKTKNKAELARELGVNRSTTTLWCAGKRIPSAEMKEKIADSSLFKQNDMSLKEKLIHVLLLCHEQEKLCIKQS